MFFHHIEFELNVTECFFKDAIMKTIDLYVRLYFRNSYICHIYFFKKPNCMSKWFKKECPQISGVCSNSYLVETASHPLVGIHEEMVLKTVHFIFYAVLVYRIYTYSLFT